MAATSRITEKTVRKAVNALLKWKTKSPLQNQQYEDDEQQEQETEQKCDGFIYLSITLTKVPNQELTSIPHKVSLPHSLLPVNHFQLNLCLIIDGKKITHQTAQTFLKTNGISFSMQVIRLSKLKSDYKTFASKKKLYDSFDVFLATKNVVSLLPLVLGKVFYKKRTKVPVPVELKSDGSNWKEEIENALKSSLWCLSGGTCSSIRVGKWGVNEGNEIVENVFAAVDGVLGIVPKKWGGVKCLHLKFSDSLALPIYERDSKLLGDENVLVGNKRKRRE